MCEEYLKKIKYLDDVIEIYKSKFPESIRLQEFINKVEVIKTRLKEEYNID